jgi:hypothetical protein
MVIGCSKEGSSSRQRKVSIQEPSTEICLLTCMYSFRGGQQDIEGYGILREVPSVARTLQPCCSCKRWRGKACRNGIQSCWLAFSGLNFELKYNFSTEDLVSKKRHSDAGRVLLDYSKDTREAVITFVQGNMFSEARRIVRVFASRPTCNADDSPYFRRQRFHPKPSSWRT